MSCLYHSSPKSMASAPFLSDEWKVLIIPALTLLSSLLNASASSASLVSWLMNTSGAPVVEDKISGSLDAFGLFWVALFG